MTSLTFPAGRIERAAYSLGIALQRWALDRAPQRLSHEQHALQLQQQLANDRVAHAALRLQQLR